MHVYICLYVHVHNVVIDEEKQVFLELQWQLGLTPCFKLIPNIPFAHLW